MFNSTGAFEKDSLNLVCLAECNKRNNYESWFKTVVTAQRNLIFFSVFFLHLTAVFFLKHQRSQSVGVKSLRRVCLWFAGFIVSTAAEHHLPHPSPWLWPRPDTPPSSDHQSHVSLRHLLKVMTPSWSCRQSAVGGGEMDREFLIILKIKWVKTKETGLKEEHSWLSSCKRGSYKCALKKGD